MLSRYRTKFPPTRNEILDELHGAANFQMDLRGGFHQIRMAPNDVFETEFRTH